MTEITIGVDMLLAATILGCFINRAASTIARAIRESKLQIRVIGDNNTLTDKTVDEGRP